MSAMRGLVTIEGIDIIDPVDGGDAGPGKSDAMEREPNGGELETSCRVRAVPEFDEL
jgi:hypothetical protein